MLGRERSIGRSDGSTSLNLDTVLILFSEVSMCIHLSHISIQTFVNSSFFNWLGVLYVAAWGRGAVGEFSCPDCSMDDIRKIAARQVFRSHTPQSCCIAKVML